jgi:four helix bundle protein
MDRAELKERTKIFGLRVIKLVEALPHTAVSRVLGDQVLRSATSVGANYRAACRARSTAEFISRIGTVEEEADETGYWLELVRESGVMPTRRLRPLTEEAEELTAIFTAIGRTAKRKRNPERKSRSSGKTNPKSEIRNPKS